MKKVFFTILLFGFGIWGCSENSNLVAPENNQTEQSFLKVPTDNSSMLMKKKVSDVINGDDGGVIAIDLIKQGVSANGTLTFSQFSFDGEVKITVELVKGIVALDFEPSGISLSSPANLSITFSGLELDDDEIYFKYIGENGEFADVEGSWSFNTDGSITVNALLYHFSRYGFTK